MPTIKFKVECQHVSTTFGPVSQHVGYLGDVDTVNGLHDLICRQDLSGNYKYIVTPFVAGVSPTPDEWQVTSNGVRLGDRFITVYDTPEDQLMLLCQFLSGKKSEICDDTD